MAFQSKEQDLLKLFFNFPTKHWRFKELKEKADLSDAKLAKWLHKFIKTDLIKKVKIENKMPYYTGNYKTPNYQNSKKIFALQEFHKSGLLNHLSSLRAKVIIIFGSFSRWDWHDKSDIDLFIFGNAEDFKPTKYEKELHREIQIFHAKNKKDLKKYGSALINNIIQGEFIKGDIRNLGVVPNA